MQLLHDHPCAKFAKQSRKLVVPLHVIFYRNQFIAAELRDVHTRAVDACAAFCHQNTILAIRLLPSSILPVLTPDHVLARIELVSICVLQ